METDYGSCPVDETDEVQAEDVLNVNQQYNPLNEDTVRRLNASYLLGTKETHKLTQRTLDCIVKNTTSIVQNSIDLLRGNLVSRLDSAGVDFKAVPGLHEFFVELANENSVITNPFLGMETPS